MYKLFYQGKKKPGETVFMYLRLYLLNEGHE